MKNYRLLVSVTSFSQRPSTGISPTLSTDLSQRPSAGRSQRPSTGISKSLSTDLSRRPSTGISKSLSTALSPGPAPALPPRALLRLLSAFLLAASFSCASAQQGAFVLSGTAKGLHQGYLYLSYRAPDGSYKSDSAALQNGSFEFKGQLNEPVPATISSVKDIRSFTDPRFAYIYIGPSRMTVTIPAGNFKSLRLEGSSENDEYAALQLKEAPIREEEAPFSKQYDSANNKLMRAMRAKAPDQEVDSLKNIAQGFHEKLDDYNEKIAAIEMDYIRTHPDSYVAANLVDRYSTRLSLTEMKGYYNAFSGKVKDSHYGETIRKEIRDLEQGSPGSPASLFSTTDIDGQPFHLADYKGKKYVLVDFWASWCVPCRRSNPHLLTLYAKYKDKGLEIVGVSDDDHDTTAWKKAVAKDHTGIWKHVLRGLKMTKPGVFDTSSDISKPYGIHSLPTKILIDRDGMIIGRYGGGGEDDEAMDKKLAEIFGS